MTKLMTDLQLSFTDELMKKTQFSDQEKQFIIRNLDKTNKELGQTLRRSEGSIRNILNKEQIRRSELQLQQIKMRTGAKERGENNPNYKGNRSSNNYFYKKRMSEKYPEKMIARNKIYRAIKSGKLKRLPCEVCGDPDTHGHHYKGYDHPLEVQWLCRKHHRLLENQKEAS